MSLSKLSSLPLKLNSLSLSSSLSGYHLASVHLIGGGRHTQNKKYHLFWNGDNQIRWSSSSGAHCTRHLISQNVFFGGGGVPGGILEGMKILEPLSKKIIRWILPSGSLNGSSSPQKPSDSGSSSSSSDGGNPSSSPSPQKPPQKDGGKPPPAEGAGGNGNNGDNDKLSSLLVKAFLWMLTAYMFVALVSLVFPGTNQPEVKKVIEIVN